MQRAHQSLHAAEVFLVEVLSDADVHALIPKVVARANTVLSRDDPRRRDVDALPSMSPGPERRAALQRVMEIGYGASDQLHARVRDFRNVLLVSALLISLLMGALVWIVAQHPAAMPLCFNPGDGAQPAVGGEQACPSGDRQSPGGGDVLIVAGLGLLGGALAAAFGIRKLRGTSTPYGVPIATALLKVPTGALTAVAGVLLLGGGFVPGLSELDSQRQILAYALLFGYAQQLATRFIDDRAQSLLDSVPSQDPEAKQPVPSMLPATAAARLPVVVEPVPVDRGPDVEPRMADAPHAPRPRDEPSAPSAGAVAEVDDAPYLTDEEREELENPLLDEPDDDAAEGDVTAVGATDVEGGGIEDDTGTLETFEGEGR